MITIHWNGSKWAGESPDSLDRLEEVLATEVLHPSFEHHRRDKPPFRDVTEAGTTLFHGNFWEVSHVFAVETDEPETIARLRSLIDANMQRPEYVAARQAFLAHCRCSVCRPVTQRVRPWR